MIRKHSHRNRGPLGKRVAGWNGDRDRGGGVDHFHGEYSFLSKQFYFRL